MKLNKYLLMAAMGLGFVACTENDLVEGGDSNGAQNEGTTYVGFTLDFSKANTKAVTTEEKGTSSEQTITKAFVLMVDDNGNIQEVVSNTDAKPGTGTNQGKQCYVFQTSAGYHWFYAVVNPDEDPEKGGKIDSYFNTAVSLQLAVITAENNFMMSNKEALHMLVDDNVTEDQAINGDKNSASINIERVPAKVTMTCDDAVLKNATTGQNEGTIQSPVFYLNNSASMSYRMAQSSIKEITNNTYTDATEATDVKIKGENETDIYKLADPVYCLENIHSSYFQKNTTYINLKTTFIPSKVVNCADEKKPLKDNTSGAAVTFYVVKTGDEDMVGNYILESDLTNYQNGDYTKLPAGVKTISEAYTNGECWFGPIWVGQEKATSSTAPIYRNTWYNLAIRSIKLPGDPQKPEIDEEGETPLIPNTNVAITLSVMPWNFIDREIDLQ